MLSYPGIRHLLWFAPFFVIVSLALHFVSIAGFFPRLHNGQGLWLFASDVFNDHVISGRSADLLQRGDYAEWWDDSGHRYPRYVKIYSIFYYLIGKSPLSLIPLKTAIYLVVVLMTFFVGKTLFSESVGFWSAVLVGMFPSFFLQATHSAKDSISIGGLFLIINAVTLFLKADQTKRSIFIIVSNALTGAWILWIFRPYMLQLVGFLWFCALAICIVRGLKERRNIALRIGVGAMLFVVYVGVSGSWQYDWSRAMIDVVRGEKDIRDPKKDLEFCMKRKWADNGYCLAGCYKRRGSVFIDRPICMIMVIEHTRWKFRRTSAGAGSNIDRYVSFRSPGDILRYVPRAIQIGLAAPFPTMWFSSGESTGRVGRLISGIETGLMYVGLLLAAFGLWKERRNPAVWLVSFFVFCGVTLLGLVVINIGALYRHRYIFWFLLIIFAVQGFNRLRERPPWSRRATPEGLV